jgi:CRISPR-associated protein (TIGR02710 family)
MAISVHPLPREGAENDPDACFDHFDAAIEALLAEGFAGTDLVADFTRGTKAMSAALVLAATRHGVPILRYVGGDRRDARGTVIAGSERIHETRTARATARRRLDLARDLVERANFAAALSLLPDPDHKLAVIGWDVAEQRVLRGLRPLVAWFAAWDRFDYTGAQAFHLPESPALPAAWRRHVPPQAVRHFVARLGRSPRSSRNLAIDIFANAARRVSQGQYEDALVRIYNVVERIARARMQDAGVIVATRAEAIEALRRRQDPMAQWLRALDRAHPALQSGARNNSILIHGHGAQGSHDPAQWQSLLDDVEGILRRDSESRSAATEFAADLAAARFPHDWSCT